MNGMVTTNQEEPTKENFLNKKKFSKMVETAVRMNGMSYLDTIVWLCEQNNIEIEDIKKYLSPSITENLEKEAMDLNFLPKVNTLDV
jgi:hypothetical protein